MPEHLSKMQSLLATAALSALAYSTVASAEPISYCPADDVCYSVGVPASAAASGSGNIYIQLRAPTSYSWFGIGQGSGMAGANMFLVYADGTGTNVTVSPRTGTGHVPPQANADAEVEVLEGTGIEDGVMVANFRCGNCDAWAGGEMSLAGASTGWIAAWKEGDALDSAEPDAQIQRHDGVDVAQLDLTQASIDEDSNPYVGSGDDDDGSTTTTPGGQTPGGGDASSGSGSGSGGAVTPGAGGGAASSGPGNLIKAHWIVMVIVWIVLFPLGSALMPLFGSWILHAAWQMITFLLMWAGFGLGYVASERIGLRFQSTHTTFGTVIVCLTALQPLGGWLHHRHYLRHGRRGAVSHAHIWYGRALMVMGVVNGGLGIRLATGGDGAGRPITIGYSVGAGVVAVIYLAAKGFGVVMKSRRRDRRGTPINGSGGEGAVKEEREASANHHSGSPRGQYA